MRRSREEWRALVEELAASGLGPTAFARKRGVHPRTLNWWRWKLERDGEEGGELSRGFLPVLVTDEPELIVGQVPTLWSEVEVELRGGVFVRFEELSVDGLRELIGVVGAS